MKRDLIITGFFLWAIILSSLILSPFVLDFTLTTRFITLALFLGVIFFIFYRTNVTLKVDMDLLLLVYVAYTLFCSSSLLWAKNTSEAIFEGCKLFLALLVFMLTLFSMKRHQHYFINNLLKFAIILFFIELAVGISQFCEAGNLSKEALYNITAINGHKNLYSGFLFLNLLFLIMAFLRLTKLWKGLAFTSIILCVMILFVLKTKAVWMGLATSMIVYFAISAYLLISNKINLKLNIYAAIISLVILTNVFFLFVLQPVIRDHITYTSKTGLEVRKNKIEKKELDDERLIIWDKTYHVFKEHPLMGVGMGNWQIYYPDAALTGLWRCEDLNVTFQRPHNDFLWILSETGIIGFNLFLFFLVGIILFLIKCITSITAHKQVRVELMLCCTAITGFFTISFFDFPKERIEHLIWINILLGISYYHIKKTVPIVSLKHISVDKTACLIISGSLSIMVCIGILRYKGELCLREMYTYKTGKVAGKVIDLCKSASSFVYTIDPTSVPISWYSGNANASVGNYKQALADFKNAYQLNPYNRNVINDLASSYAFENNIDSAKKYYEEAARISPRFDDPKLNLVAIYIKEDNYKAASARLKLLFHNSERRTAYQKIVELMIKE